VLDVSKVNPKEVMAVGITNQRETTVVWEKATGRPVGPAIVWQCRRTAASCEELSQGPYKQLIEDRTGLVIDAYFSGSKIRWLLEQTQDGVARATNGELLFGTIDTWLIWKLTNGDVHVTDLTNASRTMLMDLERGEWDDQLLRIFGIPRAMMPRIVSSREVVGVTAGDLFGAEIPIAGIAGDQQSALFGQACFHPGLTKNTYGTGCFMLMNTGSKPISSHHGMLTTIAWQLNGQTVYALEGSVFIAGAAIQWLRDGLRFFENASQSEEFAKRVPDSGGVYVVPAFAGLGAPYWDMYARGGLLGLTRGSKAEHITRATLESLAYQTKDILDAMQQDSGITLQTLRVDGGATLNDFLMQFQSDMLQLPVHRAAMVETTVLGAAHIAAVKAGLNPIEAINRNGRFRVFLPHESKESADEKYAGWQKAVKRCMKWEEE
jgi:glycerol kinase